MKIKHAYDLKIGQSYILSDGFDDNKPDQILLKSIGWVKPSYLLKLRALYKEIEKLFMISDDKKG